MTTARRMVQDLRRFLFGEQPGRRDPVSCRRPEGMSRAKEESPLATPLEADARRPVGVPCRCPFFVGQAQVVHPGGDLRGPVHGRPRHRHRERGVAVDPHRSQLHQREPAVGPHCLRDPVRRLSAARRPSRRPVRPPPDLHDRPGRLHRSLAHVRPGLVGGIADRVSRRPGLRRRLALAGRAVHPRHHVHRGSRA